MQRIQAIPLENKGSKQIGQVFDKLFMKYDIDKRKKAQSRFEYVWEYHEWLREQRKKDKKKYQKWKTDKGNELLRINICPYCKNYVQVKRFDKKIIHKICKKHGIVQFLVRKQDDKGETKNENM